ncbi:MAG: glycosyltransferase family 39 protein [Anaerolineae bacterium]|nr:glycosyltransferase family 39 protein [Anaerolineae bacterium]
MRRLPLWHIAAVLGVLWVGAALRWAHIGALPPGLYRDEAFYGLDALRLLEGDLSVYFVANNGREALFIYALAPSVAALGRTPEALRWVAAWFGVLTLAAVYAAGRAMFSPRVGLLAAAVTALTFWHVALSRVAFRAITLPLLVCLTLAAWFLTARARHAQQRYRWASLAGGAFGLTFYTYAAAPFLALLMLPLVARRACRDWRLGVAFALTALAVLLPFGIWLLRHGAAFLSRPAQVSIFSAEPGSAWWVALGENALRVLGMFFVAGDAIWRHNLPGRPVFDPALALAFVLGIGEALRRRSAASVAALGWLLVFLVPTLISADAPHFLRAIGALPAACLLAALGLDGLRRMIAASLLKRGFSASLAAAAGSGAAVLALAFGGASTAQAYFGDYVHRPLTAHWLEFHEVALGRAINSALEQQQRVLLDRRLVSESPTLRFIAPAMDFVGDMGAYFAFPLSAERGVLLVEPNHDWTALRDVLPSPAQLSVTLGPMAQNDRDPQPRRAFIAVAFEPLKKAEPQWRFGDSIELVDASVVPSADEQYAVTLAWRALRPVTEALGVFVHVLHNGQLLAQADSAPGQGYLPTYFWRPGDVIRDTLTVRVPRERAPLVIAVGMYRYADLRRLSVFTPQGAPHGDSVIIPLR